MKFCETQKAPKSAFDRRSFRWITRGKVRILIGCPIGKWNSKTDRCTVGTRAYKLLKPADRRCPAGAKRITKTR